jgi:GGDEF domain-containing protein/PAS domain-containing protein
MSSREQATVINNEAAISALFEYLKNVIYYPERAQLDPNLLPPDFTMLAQGLLYFGESVLEARTLSADIARGRLDTDPITPGNELASDLKSLQATLKHLTWQINQVAKGDYKQRVSFIGEFSVAINNMILQLDERSKTLEENAEKLRRQADKLRENNEMFLALAEHVEQWIIVLDRATGEILYSNHDAENILRDLSDKARLQAWLAEQALRYDSSDSWQPSDEKSFGEPGRWDIHDRNSQFFQIAAKPFSWQEHKALTFLLTDVTEEKRRREELESVAFFDALTGAYSRHFGMNMLERWLAQGEIFCICFVDMDNLKYVNDSFGHEVGDEYILSVSGKLAGGRCGAPGQSNNRSGDQGGKAGDEAGDEAESDQTNVVLSRLGGDEFMLLCRGWSKQETEQWLEEVREELIAESGSDYQRSISYGVVQTVGENDHSGSLLLSQADELMYEYKRSRKMERRISGP